MRLPFDENLAARLANDLVDLYPGSAHVYPGSAHVIALGLAGASDRAIWNRAGADGFTLVTRDGDFHRLSVLVGPPPKVVWIRLGNCRTADVARLLRFRADEVRAFAAHTEASFLALG